MRSPAKSKPCVHQPSGNSVVPCAAVNSCGNMCNELFQWLEVQENICKFDLYVLCDDCLIIYLYIYISVCVRARVRTVTDERNKPIKSTTESLSGVPCLGSPLRFAVQALSSCFWLRRTLPPTTPNHPGIAVRAFIIFYLVF